MSRRIRISEAADRDLGDCLNWSQANFEYEAAVRYAKLIEQAVSDLAEHPDRPGTRFRSEFGYFFYHLRNSRERAQTEFGAVKTPRHFVVYRADDSILEIVRILHESMDFEIHLDT